MLFGFVTHSSIQQVKSLVSICLPTIVRLQATVSANVPLRQDSEHRYLNGTVCIAAIDIVRGRWLREFNSFG